MGAFTRADAPRQIASVSSPKAYENPGFLSSRDARPIRILAEYLEPQSRFRRAGIRSTVVFFGSAKSLSLADAQQRFGSTASGGEEGASSQDVERAAKQIRLAHYYDDARELARRLTEWCKEGASSGELVVCSGGGPGMMEAANRGAAEAGGKSIGLNISLPGEQDPNPYISPGLSLDYHYFFMRKLWFMYLARALVVFPGGFGTMDELFEVLTLTQTRKVDRPVPVIVYGRDYWQDVINFDKFVEWGTIGPDDLELFHLVDDVDEALALLTNLPPGNRGGGPRRKRG